MPAAAARTALIEPFYVMEVVKEAAELAAAGRSVIHLSIGEPDFTAPEPVRRAACAAIERGETQYTGALGLEPLRERIADWYATRFGCRVDRQRIVITAGASGALLLTCAALLERDAEVLMPDPSYPCNRHFATALGGRARLVPCGPDQRFQLTAADVEANWSNATGGILVASPSNPTGTTVAREVLAQLIDVVGRRNGFVISDEIYQGLSYDGPPTSALQLSDETVVINSFSKYFSMTGWRLGWMVLPQELVAPVEKLAQNLYICPSSLAQHAALACFDGEALAECERRREAFRQRRDLVVPALQAMGLTVPVAPDGAFYAWADCSAYSASSWDFCFDMMRRAHVALTPGRDFGPAQAERYLRLSFASGMPQLQAAVAQLGRALGTASKQA